MFRARFTHVALQTRDIDASIAFYRKYCGLRIVHDRTEDFRVVWLGAGEQPPRFVIVLLHKDYARNEQPEYQHLGLAVERREDVDRIYAEAAREGIAVWPPTDGGPVVGYFCAVRDPDGNIVEFSHGQPIGPVGPQEARDAH